MLLALGPGGYFVFVIDEVVPDDQGTHRHIGKIRPQDESARRNEGIRQDN
jgi:membrane protein involved in colicin uptake